MLDLRGATGAEVRRQVRNGNLTGPTPGLALGYVQANLVVVPRDLAFDFLLFCQRNPQPCPLLDVTDPGCPEPHRAARGADLRTDVPRYCAYRHGELIDEPDNLFDWWRDDLVGFLLGCSFTFENALMQAGLPIRHIEQDCNVPMYRTNIACRPAGLFAGPLVVSMRPLTPTQAEAATHICRRFPLAHGEPLHVGDPAALGAAVDAQARTYVRHRPARHRSGDEGVSRRSWTMTSADLQKLVGQKPFVRWLSFSERGKMTADASYPGE
jgi:uncharacterized protein YcsI (UPF0317 family)